ncbi:MAG: peptidylprolyl isomerase [Kiritimatiellae bacterium]|nr:peptidylprolyl isomerase [Kiritimatiellia bacterium]
MNRTIKSIIGVFAALRVFVLPADDVAPAQTNALADAKSATFLGERVSLERDGGDLSDKFAKQSRDKKPSGGAAVHSPDDVFLKVGDEILLWGAVDAYVDDLFKVSPLSLPPQATPAEVEQILASARQKAAEHAGNTFLKNWLLVADARAHGIALSQEEIDVAMKKGARKIPKKFREEITAKINEKNSYFFRNQIGYLTTKKYMENVVAPSVTVSEDDIAALSAEREEEARKAREYNATLRPRIEGYLADIVAGKAGFAEIAYEFSDCGSSMDDGEWGEFDREDNQLLDPLKEFIFADSTNTLSGVIETPYSYHIVKILKRSWEEEEDGGKGPPRYVKVAHIMLEKEEEPEPLEHEDIVAIVRRQKIGRAMVELERETLERYTASPGFKCDFRVTLLKKLGKKKGKQ